jgi:uncharacterized ion transporter superfamily protein YfcC|tara:strand:- start:124 stop:507 length:384 start_codon:yes stop_codon:yes gene_type:complete
MGPLLSLLPSVLKTGSAIFANKQKAKILMSEAALLHSQKMANGEVEYQAAVRQSNDKGWKDEFVLLLVSAPVILLIWSVFSEDPDIQAKLHMFFEQFNNLPFWYQTLFVGVVASIYGLKGADIFKKK